VPLTFADTPSVVYAVAGLAALAGALLPRLVRDHWVTTPLICLALGLVLFALPLPLPALHPLEARGAAEILTEVGVVVALMGAGLKLDRAVGWRSWRTTWRLLALTIPLTIGAVALLAWGLAGLAPAAALLVAAALAPTDPVLASDVQVGPPGAALEDVEDLEDAEDEVRFALTSEAGLNDALAFPFVNAALAMIAVGAAPSGWLGRWVLVDVLFKIAVGLLAGIVTGRLLGRIAFGGRGSEGQLAGQGEGFVALAATLLAYGVTEVVGGYGFLAVFVTAVTLRRYEHDHEYHETLHGFIEQTERMLMIGLLLLLGGAVAGGILQPLTVGAVVVVVVLLLVVRPVLAWLTLPSDCLDPAERATVSVFGIRGIGSLYYVAYASTHADVPQLEQVWAMVALAVVLSIVGHGIAVTPAMRALDRRRGSEEEHRD